MHADFNLLDLGLLNIFNITMDNSNVGKCWVNSWVHVDTTLSIYSERLTLYPQAPNAFSNVGPTNSYWLGMHWSNACMLYRISTVSRNFIYTYIEIKFIQVCHFSLPLKMLFFDLKILSN